MKDVSNAVAYALLVPDLMKAGREVGYAIAVHGSLARDLDVVAIPWTEEAVPAERLILHLAAAVDGRIRNGGTRNADGEWQTAHGSAPSVKPHGRLAWTIHLDRGGLYVDVSVMPRVRTREAPGNSPGHLEAGGRRENAAGGQGISPEADTSGQIPPEG